MRLTDLDAQFVGGWNADTYHELGNKVDGAQGILFQCPLCAQGKPRGSEDGRKYVEGAHYILCWFSNPQNAPIVPAEIFPGPGRWAFSGNSVDSASLSPSVNLDVHPNETGDPHDCRWHGWVKNGDAA